MELGKGAENARKGAKVIVGEIERNESSAQLERGRQFDESIGAKIQDLEQRQ
jgi:hypothetical protein